LWACFLKPWRKQGYVENMLREFEHVLTLRVRMPIDGDVLCNKRNFIYKIAHYNKVARYEFSNLETPSLAMSHHDPLLHISQYNISVTGYGWYGLLGRCKIKGFMWSLEKPVHPSIDLDVWSQVVNIPNSMTVLPELLPYAIEMALRRLARASQ